MGGPVTANKKSKTFPIVISVVVVIMLIIVVATVSSQKEAEAGKIEVSPSVSISASTVDGNIGEKELPVFDDAAAAGTDPAVGMIVPQFTAQNFQDEAVTIAPTGEPYAIAFLAHWCPHCQAEVPKLVELELDGKLPEGIDIVGVATGTNEEQTNYPPSKWLINEEWPWTAVADSQGADIAKAFGLQGYPYVIYVNADGTVYKRTSGEVDESQILANMNAIAASK